MSFANNMDRSLHAIRSPGVITGHGETMVVVASCLLVASTIVVGLRVYTRITRMHKVDLSDWLMITAWLLEVVHVIFIAVAFTYGLAKHFDELKPYYQKMTLFYAIGFIELFAVTPCMFGRLSFAVFLLALLGRTMKWKRWVLWTVIIVQVLVNAIVILQIYAQCNSKPAALWDPKVREHAHCQSPSVQTNIGYVQSALNSWADTTLTAVPAFILWDLQLPRQTKSALACVLMLSIFAFAASIVKCIEIKNLSATGDFSWFMTNLQIWVCVENNVVMMTASTPALKPLFGRRSEAGSSLVPYGNSYELGGTGRSGTVGSTGWNKSRHDRRRQSDIAMSYGDTQSEEHILSIEPDHTQIKKTTDVHISYGQSLREPASLSQGLGHD